MAERNKIIMKDGTWARGRSKEGRMEKRKDGSKQGQRIKEGRTEGKCLVLLKSMQRVNQ